MTNLLTKISAYLIAPIMVIMTTWFIQLFPLSAMVFPVVFGFSFFLLMVLVSDFKHNNTEKNTIEKNTAKDKNTQEKPTSFSKWSIFIKEVIKIFRKEVIKDVSIYMMLAIVAGTLFDIASRLIIPTQIDYRQLNMPLVVFVLFSLLLVFIHYKISSDRWRLTFSLILFFFMALAAMQLYPALLAENIKPFLFIFHTIALTTYAIFVFHGVARVLTKPVNLIRKNQLSPKKHLILFVSVLRSKADIKYWEQLTTGLTKIKALKNKTLLEIAHYIMENRKFDHSWEMLLRSIAYHLEPKNKKSKAKLEQITLLASSGKVPMKDPGLKEQHDKFTKKIESIEEIIRSKGKTTRLLSLKSKLKKEQDQLGCYQNSMDQVHHFIDFLEEYIKINKIELNIQLLIMDKNNRPSLLTGATAKGEKHINKLGIEFNDFEEVFNGLICIRDNVVNKRYKLSETVIDFTGGQKSTTAAATLLATSSSVRNQYVNTNDKKEVIGYNFINENPVQGA